MSAQHARETQMRRLSGIGILALFDTGGDCGIIEIVTQTISGRFFILNAGVFQHILLGPKRPILADNRPVVCVTTSAAKVGRFAVQGEIAQ